MATLYTSVCDSLLSVLNDKVSISLLDESLGAGCPRKDVTVTEAALCSLGRPEGENNWELPAAPTGYSWRKVSP